MRLDELYIGQFKNLRDFHIDFDETVLTTVLIGENATGKSNLIEALVIIFRDLDLGEKPKFRYRLAYTCRDRAIEVDADPNRIDGDTAQITVDSARISLRQLSQAPGRIYLPTNVFGYYSGPSRRLEEHFDTHQERFYRQLLAGEEEPLRPLFYARLIHSQFVLLAFYSFDDPALDEFLEEYLDITGLESVLFVLREPPWWQKRKYSDDMFWGARGVVRTFLEELYDLALEPIKRTERVPTTPWGTGRRAEQRLYLYVQDRDRLHQLARKYGTNTNFFKTLESTYISDLIHEVRIRVTKPDVPGGLTFAELSEGAQQLLTVLGLLRFTKEDESLFLLDEPDTHLNPAWKLEYMSLLDKVVGEQKSSQIILATHDPIVIGGLTREQVRVLERRSGGQIVSRKPEKDPAGMGVAALLTSDMFGLRTSLDLRTQRKLDRKRELVLKREKQSLDEDEQQQLERLEEELKGLDFTHTVRDPMYARFVVAMSEHTEFQKPVLTSEEREEQARLAREIVKRLQEETK